MVLTITLLLVAESGCSTSSGAADCDWQSGKHTIDIDGAERTYEVDVADLAGPVVLSLHGATGNPDNHEATTRVAATSKGVVITPDGGSAWRHRSEKSPDVDFLAALLCGDDVHAVGFSSGGMMATRLACEGLVDSAVVVGGMVEIEPCDERPPLLVIHGIADDTVGWDGSMPEGPAMLVGYRQGPTVPELVNAWGPAELVAHDGGHVWPDDATERAWDFIMEH